ncbi:hypothetical protein ES703_05860 [subsurface metagenome]
MNIINNIIKKIRYKDKELEGMYVAIDVQGKIIGFDKDLDKLQFYIGTYNEEKYLRGRTRLFKLDKINLRKRIKRVL